MAELVRIESIGNAEAAMKPSSNPSRCSVAASISTQVRKVLNASPASIEAGSNGS